MKFIIALIVCLLTLNTFANITTCDQPDLGLEVIVDESSALFKIKVIGPPTPPPQLSFEEVVAHISVRQLVLIDIFGEPLFVDAFVYQSQFGTSVSLYELPDGRIEGFYEGMFDQGQERELKTCVVAVAP